LGPLNTFNTLFQSEESKVVVLHDQMAHLMQSILTKFVKACIIMDCRRLVDVPFENQENQVDIEIGTKAREVIDQCQSTHASDIESEDPLEQEQQLSLDPAIEARFFRSVRLFYITLVNKMLQKFPFTNIFLKDLKLLQPTHRLDVTAHIACHLADNLPSHVRSTR
jgi:hypothetical protein